MEHQGAIHRNAGRSDAVVWGRCLMFDTKQVGISFTAWFWTASRLEFFENEAALWKIDHIMTNAINCVVGVDDRFLEVTRVRRLLCLFESP